MGLYSDLPKLSRVKLPSGTTYALIDLDGRSLLAGNYSSAASYNTGDYVIYNDNLYLCTGSTTGTWDPTKWSSVTVSSELKQLKQSIAGGIHFRGYTTTSLKEDSTTNPILINGSSYTAEAGDLVIETPPAYATNTAYSVGEYVTYSSAYYEITADITAANNTGWAVVSKKLVSNEPEFIWDGSHWSQLGSLNPSGLGSLAYKDTATGNYTKPTGSGTVTVPTVTPSTGKLSTTTVTGTDGTVNASLVSGGTEKDIAKVGTATRYGTANVGSATRYGTANVGTAVAVGTALGGTTTFNTDAIKAAELTGTKTFNTDAIKAASLTGTTTFTTAGITVQVISDGEGTPADCLEFSTASTGTVGISTTAASTGTVGISTTSASTASVTLTTSDITPAAEAPNNQTLTPAAEAPNDQTLTPAESNGKLTGSYTISGVTPAKVAASATTVATGTVESGNQLVTAVSVGTDTATVSVGTTTDTVTVS